MFWAQAELGFDVPEMEIDVGHMLLKIIANLDEMAPRIVEKGELLHILDALVELAQLVLDHVAEVEPFVPMSSARRGNENHDKIE